MSFTDDANNSETLTSAATTAVTARPNSPPTGAPTIDGTVQAGQTLTAITTGISDADGLTNVSYTYQWLADDADIEGKTGSTYLVANVDVGKTIRVRATFTDDQGTSETLTSAGTAAVIARTEPLTVSLVESPAGHDGSGSTEFTIEIRFSEEFKLSFVTLADALTHSGVSVIGVSRAAPRSNIGWDIKVTPAGDGDVTVVLPATTSCDDDGAICTRDNRMLSNGLEITVRGPGG